MPTTDDLQTDFLVSYEGAALAAHTMEVRDLAPALLALGQAFDRANSILNGDRASMSLEIRATQAGSFEIGLLLKQLYDQGISAFSGDFITSAANIKELFFGGAVVTAGGGGLIGLIKWLRGKRITKATVAGSDMILEVENLRLTIPLELFKLANDMPLRDQLAAVVRPLSKDGIERLTFKDDSRELESVNKDEAHFFRGADADYKEVTTNVFPRQRLKPASVSFIKKGKWRLSDGAQTHWYTVRDESFLKNIADGEIRLGAKDVFICEVLMLQSVTEEGELKMEYEISAVLDHITPAEQARLLNDDAGITFQQPLDDKKD
jgi:hypothetical protein